jgi:hypothetical protein
VCEREREAWLSQSVGGTFVFSKVAHVLRIHPTTGEEEEEEEEELSWQSCNLCSRNLIALSPFPRLVASFIELYSFNHATVFIHFFVQWASEEIEKV